jgi:hypothetical protein
MRSRRAFLALGPGLVLASLPLAAHHSTAMYDMENPVTVTGTVVQFRWSNPHAYITLKVKDDKGNEVEWSIELMSLNHLKSYGWMHNTIKEGDVITCTGGPAKSGQPAMIASLIKLPDGRQLKS